MRARAVPTDQLAAVRDADWVDPARHPWVEGETAWVPVKEGFPCERELPDRHLYCREGFFYAWRCGRHPRNPARCTRG